MPSMSEPSSKGRMTAAHTTGPARGLCPPRPRPQYTARAPRASRAQSAVFPPRSTVFSCVCPCSFSRTSRGSFRALQRHPADAPLAEIVEDRPRAALVGRTRRRAKESRARGTPARTWQAARKNLRSYSAPSETADSFRQARQQFERELVHVEDVVVDAADIGRCLASAWFSKEAAWCPGCQKLKPLAADPLFAARDPRLIARDRALAPLIALMTVLLPCSGCPRPSAAADGSCRAPRPARTFLLKVRGGLPRSCRRALRRRRAFEGGRGLCHLRNKASVFASSARSHLWRRYRTGLRRTAFSSFVERRRGRARVEDKEHAVHEPDALSIMRKAFVMCPGNIGVFHNKKASRGFLASCGCEILRI